MAGGKKPRTARVKAVAQPAIVVPEVRKLKAFYDGAGQMPDFGYARFYWAVGDGPRESILPRLVKKRWPAAAESDIDTAARVEALVPSDAPEDYADPDFLARRYEETLALNETTAYAQVTLRFPSTIANLHHPYEVARAWLRDFLRGREASSQERPPAVGTGMDWFAEGASCQRPRLDRPFRRGTPLRSNGAGRRRTRD